MFESGVTYSNEVFLVSSDAFAHGPQNVLDFVDLLRREDRGCVYAFLLCGNLCDGFSLLRCLLCLVLLELLVYLGLAKSLEKLGLVRNGYLACIWPWRRCVCRSMAHIAAKGVEVGQEKTTTE